MAAMNHTIACNVYGKRNVVRMNFLKEWKTEHGITYATWTTNPAEAKRYTYAEAEAEERRFREQGSNAYAFRV